MVNRKWYQYLLDKANLAFSSEFYIEAATLYYAVIDARLLKIMERIGYVKPTTGYPLMIGKKIKYLKDNRNSRLIAFGLNDSFFIDLEFWVARRNEIVHNSGNNTSNIVDFEAEIYDVSLIGKGLAGKACTIAMHQKKKP